MLAQSHDEIVNDSGVLVEGERSANLVPDGSDINVGVEQDSVTNMNESESNEESNIASEDEDEEDDTDSDDEFVFDNSAKLVDEYGRVIYESALGLDDVENSEEEDLYSSSAPVVEDNVGSVENGGVIEAVTDMLDNVRIVDELNEDVLSNISSSEDDEMLGQDLFDDTSFDEESIVGVVGYDVEGGPVRTLSNSFLPNDRLAMSPSLFTEYDQQEYEEIEYEGVLNVDSVLRVATDLCHLVFPTDYSKMVLSLYLSSR